MIEPTLVVLAAGMGSRYGGLKQIDPVGPNGEVILEFSIYDAIKAGFGKVVFVIKEDKKEIFHERIGSKVEKLIKVEYVFQKLEDLPEGFKVPEGRVKPWGTAHAVFSCRNAVNTPFAVINADDFYGYSTFKIIRDFLVSHEDSNNICNYGMVGFILENTLTENGSVARGICSVDNDGYLMEVHERTQIKSFNDVAMYTEDNKTWIELPKGSIVSMNIWGFTPNIFSHLQTEFCKFLEQSKVAPIKTEFFLSGFVHDLIQQGQTKVKVLSTKEQWYGVTYQEDKPAVKEAIGNMIQQGIYPKSLWDNSLT